MIIQFAHLGAATEKDPGVFLAEIMQSHKRGRGQLTVIRIGQGQAVQGVVRRPGEIPFLHRLGAGTDIEIPGKADPRFIFPADAAPHPVAALRPGAGLHLCFRCLPGLIQGAAGGEAFIELDGEQGGGLIVDRLGSADYCRHPGIA